MTGVEISFDKRFKKNLAGRFGKYEFQVGVLKDGPHYKPKRGVRGLKGQEIINIFAAGPVRQKTHMPSGLSISDVSRAQRQHLGFNYLTRPFTKKSSDIIKFTKTFFDLAFGRSQAKRLENLLQAIVRNPILRGDYGRNSRLTRRIKGFDRKMIDTAQLFKGITAKVRVRRV